MELSWKVGLVVLVSSALVGAQDLNSTGRDYSYPGGDGFPGGYEYQPSHHYPDKWGGSYPSVPVGCVLPMMNTISSLGGKALIAALVGIALVKLPLLILVKTALLKLTLPLGILATLLPVALPLIYMLLPKGSMGSQTNSTTPSRGRSDPDDLSTPLQTFLESPECIESIACKIGTSQARSQYAKPILWILKRVSTFFEGPAGNLVDNYRVSYRLGLSGGPCPSNCDTKLVLHQGTSAYNVL